MLVGLSETGLIALIGVTVLLLPRILPVLSRRFGAWYGMRQAIDESPVETAAHVYDTASPVVNATGAQKEQVFLRQARQFLRKR